MRLFGISFTPRQTWSVVGDVLAASVAIYLAHFFRFGPGNVLVVDPTAIVRQELPAVLIFLSANLLTLFMLDAYSPSIDFRRPVQLGRLWAAPFSALIFEIVVDFFFPSAIWGRGIATLSTVTFAALLTLWRFGIARFAPWPTFRRRTLVVGDGEPERIVWNLIKGNAEYRQMYDLLGVVTFPRFGYRRREDTPPPPSIPDDMPVLGAARELRELVGKHQIELIIVAVRGTLSSDLARVLLECKAQGVRVEEMPTIYKRLTGKVPIFHTSDNWLIFGPVFASTSTANATIFRVADITCALIGLLLSAIPVALAAALVKLDSKGPAFYLQERLGYNERPFKIIKLRTMREDAEAKTGAVWSQGAADPRITRVGRFLRRTRLDELPQFWNVLVGDMSIVGPRPEREVFIRKLKDEIPFYSLRFAVKPGVTGWAQVNFRYGASVDDAAEKLCYEVFAIQEMTLALYVVILVKTVQTMLFKPGS